MTPQAERLLFENEACIVINKLPGESSEQPDLAAPGERFVVHRLDIPVSGCLLLAKTPEAAAFLCGAFASSASCPHPAQVEKRYWAIVEKPKENNSFSKEGEVSRVLEHGISFNKKENKSFAHDVKNETPQKAPLKKQKSTLKKAILRYRVIGQGEHYLFMEIDLVTGRHHQIRAQLAALGLHIKGDLKYGSRRSEENGGIRLHAHSLAFPNPQKPDEIIRVKAPPPVMDPLWTAFEKAAGECMEACFSI